MGEVTSQGSSGRDHSLYNGYPTGYLIIWQNPDVKLKDGRDAVGKKVLIDGQQRITALMTAITGRRILTEDYEEKTMSAKDYPVFLQERRTMMAAKIKDYYFSL